MKQNTRLPRNGPGVRAPMPERFWRRVEKSSDVNGCWLWQGQVDKDGYGLLHDSEKPGKRGNIRAHRYSWRLHSSDPGEKFVCHHCDTPGCVRPDHLFLGTCDDNLKDMAAKGRGWGPRGTRHHATKLTESKVIGIRRSWNNGLSRAAISELFGQKPQNVWKIVKRKTWDHVA